MLLSQQEKKVAPEVKAGIKLRCPQCGGLIGDLPKHQVVLTCCTLHYEYALPARSVAGAFARPRSVLRPLRRRLSTYSAPMRAEAATATITTLRFLIVTSPGVNSWQWAIRARTFRYIERKILPGIITLAQPALRVLDLGAGNGWMSYRLAKQGHAPVAVDLITNDQDGLEAASITSNRCLLSSREFRRNWITCRLPMVNSTS